MHITQRQVVYGVFVLMLIVGIAYGLGALVLGDRVIAATAFGSSLVYGALLAAYRRGWNQRGWCW